MPERYLDTLSFDAVTNTETPTVTSKPRSYINTLKNVPAGHFAFGHISPLFVTPNLLKRKAFKVVCVGRNPRDVLISEFIDFRFRRRDVGLVSRNAIKDTRAAFEKYMSQHATVIANVCRLFAFLKQSMTDPLYSAVVPPEIFHFTSFEGLLRAETPTAAIEVARFLGCAFPVDVIVSNWEASVAGDNKTKATNVEIDVPREELWTRRALDLYKRAGFEELEKYFV